VRYVRWNFSRLRRPSGGPPGSSWEIERFFKEVLNRGRILLREKKRKGRRRKGKRGKKGRKSGVFTEFLLQNSLEFFAPPATLRGPSQIELRDREVFLKFFEPSAYLTPGKKRKGRKRKGKRGEKRKEKGAFFT